MVWIDIFGEHRPSRGTCVDYGVEALRGDLEGAAPSQNLLIETLWLLLMLAVAFTDQGSTWINHSNMQALHILHFRIQDILVTENHSIGANWTSRDPLNK